MAPKSTSKPADPIFKNEFVFVWQLRGQMLICRWPSRDIEEAQDWVGRKLAQQVVDGDLTPRAYADLLSELDDASTPIIMEDTDSFHFEEL